MAFEAEHVNLKLAIVSISQVPTRSIHPSHERRFPDGVRFGVQKDLSLVVVATDSHDGVALNLIDTRRNNLTAFLTRKGGCNFEHLTLPFHNTRALQGEIVKNAKYAVVVHWWQASKTHRPAAPSRKRWRVSRKSR